MNAEHENAIRAVAKKCRAEIIKFTSGKHKSEHDRITTLLLDKYTKQIATLPLNTFPAKRWLSYYVSQVDKEIRQ